MTRSESKRPRTSHAGLSLAAGFTVAVIAVRAYFLPAVALALAATLFWGARRLRCELAAHRAEGWA